MSAISRQDFCIATAAHLSRRQRERRVMDCIGYLEHLRAWAIVDDVFVVAVVLVAVGLLVRWKWREIVEYLGGALESEGGEEGAEGGAEGSWEKEGSVKNCRPAKGEGAKNCVEADGTEDRRRKEAWTKYWTKLRGEEEIRRESGVKGPWKKERWMQNGPKSAWTKERWTKHGWLEER